MELDKKLQKANNQLKEIIKKTFTKDSWVYVDFVKEDRFLNDIRDDKDINLTTSSVEDIVEYIYEKLSENCKKSNLLGF